MPRQAPPRCPRACLPADRNPWGSVRIGRILEDLDSLAGLVAFDHWWVLTGGHGAAARRAQRRPGGRCAGGGPHPFHLARRRQTAQAGFRKSEAACVQLSSCLPACLPDACPPAAPAAAAMTATRPPARRCW